MEQLWKLEGIPAYVGGGLDALRVNRIERLSHVLRRVNPVVNAVCVLVVVETCFIGLCAVCRHIQPSYSMYSNFGSMVYGASALSLSVISTMRAAASMP